MWTHNAFAWLFTLLGLFTVHINPLIALTTLSTFVLVCGVETECLKVHPHNPVYQTIV